MYDTVVIPTDGSEHSVQAAERGLALARRYGSTPHVISIVDVQRAAGLFSAGGISNEFVDQVEAAGREAVRAIEEIARDEDAVRSAVVQGSLWKAPSAGILEYATDHDADLIVIGTHGRTGLDRTLAGSVTERVVRSSSVPVLTVRAADHAAVSEYDRILVPTDGSEYAAAAIDHALSVAQACNASIHVLFVVDIESNTMVTESSSYALLQDELETIGQEVTGSIGTQIEEIGLNVVTEIHQGFPPGTILEYVADREIDLVVMGTHGRTGLNRVLLGSTAARVIREAEVPVLSVKPDSEDRSKEASPNAD